MAKIPFSEDELKVLKEEETRRGKVITYNYPVTPREAVKAMIWDKKPIWLLTGGESTMFTPAVIPDNIARGFVFEGGERWPIEKFGGKDMFGVEWVYVPQVGGSMVKPGNPLLEDANDWEEKVIFPDIDSWDWEGSAEINKELLSGDKFNCITFLNGCWFERVISFMDFEGAAMAVIDEDQVDAVKALIHKMTDLYMAITDKCFQYYNLDGICIHDDWGSQMAPFFSANVARDIFLPEMKRFVDHVHAMGYPVELHSCGHNETRCDIFAEAGFDSWSPMDMNDTVALFDKYGDKIAIGVIAEEELRLDPATATPEEMAAAGKAFADRFAVPGKICTMSRYNAPWASREFREAVYKESRLNYLQQ